MPAGDRFLQIYNALNDYYGDLQWWPGDTPFEVIVGAILTQNTAWKNVETAINRLKAANMLHVEKMLNVSEHNLAELIRSAGYFRVKAKRLKAFLGFLDQHYQGNLNFFLTENLWVARGKLLSVHGIGEETADSILLYAARKPIFVVDAYTRRIMARHRIIGEKMTYADIQSLFMTILPINTALYNQYHALLVHTGKQFCKKKNPRCKRCPLDGHR